MVAPVVPLTGGLVLEQLTAVNKNKLKTNETKTIPFPLAAITNYINCKFDIITIKISKCY